MNDYKSQPEDRKKVEKVVTGTVQTRKKGELRKFADVFISDDVSNVKSYIFMDVLVPAIKNTILDIIIDSAKMIFGNGRGTKSSSSAGYVSYNRFSDKKDDRSYSESRTRTGYGHDDIILETRAEAEEVLRRMDELIDAYGMVSVADMYDLVGKSCNYTDNKYGWTNIRNAEPVRMRDGYMLKLPKALPIG